MKKLTTVILVLLSLSSIAVPRFELEIIEYYPESQIMTLPAALSDDGTVVYNIMEDFMRITPYRYQNGVKQKLFEQDKTVASNTTARAAQQKSGYAVSINDKNHIVGTYNREGEATDRTFLYQDGEFVDLGLENAQLNARDINNQGVIIGTMYSEDLKEFCPYDCAVLWDADLNVHNMNDLVDLKPGQENVLLEQPWQINDNNEIVLEGEHNGKQFLGVLRVKD